MSWSFEQNPVSRDLIRTYYSTMMRCANSQGSSIRKIVVLLSIIATQYQFFLDLFAGTVRQADLVSLLPFGVMILVFLFLFPSLMQRFAKSSFFTRQLPKSIWTSPFRFQSDKTSVSIYFSSMTQSFSYQDINLFCQTDDVRVFFDHEKRFMIVPCILFPSTQDKENVASFLSTVLSHARVVDHLISP